MTPVTLYQKELPFCKISVHLFIASLFVIVKNWKKYNFINKGLSKLIMYDTFVHGKLESH